MINYIIESTLSLALSYSYFHFVLRDETCHGFKRSYLLLSSLMSILLPLFHFRLFGKVPAYTYSLPELQVAEVLPNLSSSLPIIEIALFLYTAIFCVLIGRFMIQTMDILRIIKSSQPVDHRGYKLISMDEGLAPSSFLDYIFWNKSTDVNSDEGQIILQHEIAHVRGRHSYDLIYFELLRALFWFNPFVYYYKRASALNIEYLADQQSAPNDHQQYNSLLAINAIESFGFSMENYFNKSFTLKRIKMLNRKNQKASWNKIYASLPLIIALFIIISCDTTDIQDVNELKALNEEVLLIADVIPEPEGGIQGFYSYVASHLLYPTQAKEAGIEGKVYVQFTVTKEGNVTDVSIKEGIGAGCDEECVRVMKSFQNWTPGVKDGKNVNVQMILPITFKLKS